MTNNILTIKRAAKLSTGNYENTDVSVELSRELLDGVPISEQAKLLMEDVESILRDKIDAIELGKRKIDSKAKRFGV